VWRLSPRRDSEVQPLPVPQCNAGAQQRRHRGFASVNSKVVMLPKGRQHCLNLVERKLVANAGAGAAAKC
jgi:hypothetical protein